MTAGEIQNYNAAINPAGAGAKTAAGVGSRAQAGVGATAQAGAQTASGASLIAGNRTGASLIASMAQDESFESKLRSAMTADSDAELKDACVQFEELMLGIMYKSMKATIQRAELIKADPGREIFEQWQDDALMKKIAERGTFGLADMMYKQLSRRMQNAYEFIGDGEAT